MKHILSSILIACTAMMTYAFTIDSTSEVVGTYGVSSNDPSKIELQLSEDHSFSFQDFSDFDNKIQVSGTWEVKGNHVVLSAKDSETDFHQKWKVTEQGTVAKSRKGMCFYTLRKVE